VLQAARSPRFAHLVATLVALSVPALGLGAGCATSTEFIKEGPGQPSDRASGAVPDGALGVCKVPLSKRPPLVNASLWEHAKNCNAKTPERFLRLGYGNSAGADDAAAADQEMASLLETLRDGAKVDGGNQKMVTLMRKLRELAIKDEDLRDRVSKATARTAVCDYTYMLNVMEREHLALSKDDACALRVYDPREKTEVCLFDTQLAEGRWLTSAWGLRGRSERGGGRAVVPPPVRLRRLLHDAGELRRRGPGPPAVCARRVCARAAGRFLSANRDDARGTRPRETRAPHS
jgi:hypothetical protein